MRDAEPNSRNGETSSENESPPDLHEILCHLGLELRQTNELLRQVIAQNSDLIQMLSDSHSEEPSRDLAGRPLK